MQADQVERVVAQLKARGVPAHVHRADVFRTAVRVVLAGGREALWSGGAGGLEATVLANGVLVGFVPLIKGSEDFTDAQVVAAIAGETYQN